MYHMIRTSPSVTMPDESTIDFEIDGLSEGPSIASHSSFARVQSRTEFANLVRLNGLLTRYQGSSWEEQAYMRIPPHTRLQVPGTRDLHNNHPRIKHHHHHHHHHQGSTSISRSLSVKVVVLVVVVAASACGGGNLSLIHI